MNLSKLFILRPVMTTLVMIGVAFWGGISFFKLPISALPDVQYPIINVSAAFPGCSPEIMANTIASPLEQKFMQIPGITNIFSTSSLGKTSIVLQFDININIDLVAIDVQTAINNAQSFLPPNIPSMPTFKKVNPADSPIYYISVSSDSMTLGSLYDYAFSAIAQKISIIDGVSEVSVYGTPKAVRAQLDPGYLAALGLGLSDVSEKITNQNQYKPLGQFDGPALANIIYDNGGLYSAEEYQDVIIRYENGAPLRLSDVGVVFDSVSNDRGIREFVTKTSNKPALILAVRKQNEGNVVAISDKINIVLDKLSEELPDSLDIVTVYDKSKPIKKVLNEVEETLIIAFFLVILIIFVYLGKLKETINPALSMPMSILATFGFMSFMGYTLDNLSLLALILSVGFIIDDAIVVLENIERHVESGQSSIEAAIDGSKQISTTILSMTLSLAAVFIPLLYMPGIVGKLFHEFAVVLTFVTLMSGVVSLTLNPMLCSRFVFKAKKNSKILEYSIKLNQWMIDKYKKPLSFFIDHPWLGISIALISVGLSVALLAHLPASFFPQEDLGNIMLYTEAAQGTSSTEMNNYHRQLYEKIIQLPSIKNITSISAVPSFRQGIMYIALEDRKKRDSLTAILNQINQIGREIPGLNIYLKPVSMLDFSVGTSSRADYQYLMQSLDEKSLYEAGQNLFFKLKQDPMFESVSTNLEINTPQINLNIQRDLASSLGITIEDIEKAMALGFSQNWITRIQTPINQYNVIMELMRNLQDNPSSLAQMYIKSSSTNAFVPLTAIVDISEGVGPASINHFSQFPSISIDFNIVPGVPLSEALKKLYSYADEFSSEGISGQVKGAAEVFEETYKGAILLIIVAIAVIYMVLGILYESFIHPLTVLSTLPPAIFGALFTLWILNIPFSLFSFLGIIMLLGIIKKNGIMIVDFALDNIRMKKSSPKEAIYEASLVRFRPIMMTTVAAIFGAIPVALNEDAGRHALGVVIIGGLVISQMVTLFITPVIFLEFEKLREKFLIKKTGIKTV
jgi:HAE1 family hydrophobic/amphiphilic exporter-1